MSGTDSGSIELTPEEQEKAKALLDRIVEEQDINELIRQHNAECNKRPPICLWEPCSYVLFSQFGETHEEYHQRRGSV